MAADTASEKMSVVENGSSSSPAPMAPVARKTITCFLCGGTHIYPGPRYENHLMNEHGVVFDTQFMIQVSLYKQDKGALPSLDQLLNNVTDVNGLVQDHTIKKEIDTKDGECQTEQAEEEKNQKLCSKCKDTIQPPSKSILQSRLVQGESNNEESDFDDTMAGFEDEDEDISADDEDDEDMMQENDKVLAFVCPFCPKVYKRFSYFKQHTSEVHSMEIEDIESIEPVSMTEEEFLKQQEAADKELNEDTKDSSGGLALDKTRGFGNRWAPNSFSSTFTCIFCNEQFRKDYKLKLHLMLNHKNESVEDMEKAKEELTKSKLDGCVHKCGICGSKYNSVANFTRHVKDAHNMSRAQYKEEHGSSEVVSRMFKCELCEKEVKHTRNIIGAHMKMVHLISWREYQDILNKMRRGEIVGDLPAPELFECIICGVSVKYKREHLNKKHQITEDLYDELIAKKSRGEDITDALPEREVHKCLICDRECLDIKKHIERSHQISEEMYDELVVTKRESNKTFSLNSHQARVRKDGIMASKPGPRPGFKSFRKSESPPLASTSGAVSTDLQCYFGCDEYFKKDYQLYLHLKLRHRHEDPEEVKRAYQAAEEEIAFTKRSGSVYQCALCNKQFNDNGAFYSHIQTRHNMQWREYKDKFGRCEIESSPFECKICNRVIKYDRNTVHTHLKHVHGINWELYLDRIRKQRRGEVPDDLPQIEMTECRVCNVNVKYLRDHLRNAHKITEQEYESLFMDEDDTIRHSAASNSNIMRPIEPRLPTEPLPVQSLKVPKPPKTDIQDKTNKKCSSCNIAFDSRRSFIEHCTTVHNMKFKTKSGVTISAPTMNQPPPMPLLTQGLKRKAFEPPSMIERPPPLKMAKTMMAFATPQLQQPDLAEENGSVLHMAPQYSPSGVSKWNQCRYECCFCKKTTMSRSSMTSHIHNTHGIPIKEYKESNYPDIEVETNWFQCRLCSARTKFVKDCIAPHLKMSHNMDIEAYEQDYMQPEDWPTNNGPRSTMRHDKPVVSVQRRKPALPQQQAVFLSPQENSVEESIGAAGKVDKWNKCRYKCCLCEWVSIDSRQMRAHIATNHGMTYDIYVKQYGSSEVVTKKFRCELCNSEMKHCRQNIYAHMKDVHKISLAEYEERVDMKEVDVSDQQQEQGDAYNPITVQAPINPQARQQQQQPFVPGLLDNGAQPSRWNRCRFQCALCLKLSSEKRHIREHVVKIHAMSMPEYEEQFGDCEIHTEYFFCGVCHAEVKHNLKNVSLHLQNVHKMSASDYEAQFGRLPDDEVIIEQRTDDHQQQQQPQQQPGILSNEEYGFGAHFLLEDVKEEEDSMKGATHQMEKVPPPPPRADVTNPRNKYCRTCNRDFNRRQAFVEHCRHIHGMKIKFATSNVGNRTNPPSMPIAASAGANNLPKTQEFGGGHPCDYCGKVFSNRSNRNRHIILSCDVRKNGGTPITNAEKDSLQDISRENSMDQYNEDDQTMMLGEAEEEDGGGENGHFEIDGSADDDETNGDEFGNEGEDPDHLVIDENQEMNEFQQEKCTDEDDNTIIEAADETSTNEMINDSQEDEALVSVEPIIEEEEEIEANDEAVGQETAPETDKFEEGSEKEKTEAQEESLKLEEEEEEEQQQQQVDLKDEGERKVPPLRVKLSGLSPNSNEKVTAELIKPVHDELVQSPPNAIVNSNSPTKDLASCNFCKFQSKNPYILGRHQKACQKRKQSTEEATTQLNDNLQDAIESEEHSKPKADC